MGELDRRDFLKLVGAGAGAAAATGCAEKVEQLIPYVVQPEEITPGVPVWYASTCGECAALHADLGAIAAATRALPDPIRPRSFTLSAEQAERLRPTGWRRLSGLRLDQRRFTRPMAIACTTLGLAGLLLAALPSAPLGLLTFVGGAAAPSHPG